MAAFTPVSFDVPSNQRSTIVTGVEAGDVIDFVQILGRPAKAVIVTAADAADVVEYRLNNKKIVKVLPPAPQFRNKAAIAFGGKEDDVVDVEVMVRDDSFPVFSTTGETWQTAEGLAIACMDIVSITGPASIKLVAF